MGSQGRRHYSTKESTEPTTESTTTTAAVSSTSSTVEATAPTTESTTVAESTTESTTASTTASTAASTSQEPSSVSQTTATQSSTEAWCNGETHRYKLVYHCWLNKVQTNSRNCLAVTFIAGDWISCFVAWVCAHRKAQRQKRKHPPLLCKRTHGADMGRVLEPLHTFFRLNFGNLLGWMWGVKRCQKGGVGISTSCCTMWRAVEPAMMSMHTN